MSETLRMRAQLTSLRLPAVAALLAALTPALAAGAPEIEVGLIAGGQQTGSLGTRAGTLELAAGILYGVSVGWRVRADGIVEISWSRQESEASGDLRSGPERFDVTIDSAEIGGLWETRPGSMRPFLGLFVGGTRLAGPEQPFGEGWYLSGAISGGVRWLLGEHATLRLEARATGVLLSEGGALACSFPPGGCQLAVSGEPFGAVSGRALLAARF